MRSLDLFNVMVFLSTKLDVFSDKSKNSYSPEAIGVSIKKLSVERTVLTSTTFVCGNGPEIFNQYFLFIANAESFKLRTEPLISTCNGTPTAMSGLPVANIPAAPAAKTVADRVSVLEAQEKTKTENTTNKVFKINCSLVYKYLFTTLITEF